MLPPLPNSQQGLKQRPGLLAFRNACGRRGCGHIFEYDGADPLGNIHRLVREHSPLCGGLRAESSITFWRQPKRAPPPPPAEEASSGSSSASSAGSGSGAGDITRASSPSTATSASASISSVAATRLRTRRPHAREPSATPSSASGSSSLPSLLDADATGAASDSSAPGTGGTRSGNEKSKSAHTEPQRRALLAADPLIRPGSITPHTVGCAVCKKTIRLDRRSRYYPGLWVKHRVRCVKDQEEGRHGDRGERDPSVIDIKLEGMEVAREEEALRPRRSYYRPIPK